MPFLHVVVYKEKGNNPQRTLFRKSTHQQSNLHAISEHCSS